MAEANPHISRRVGICADVLMSWSGGRDLLVMTIRAMHAARPSSQICLLVPSAPPEQGKITWNRIRYQIKDAVKAVIGRPRLKEDPATTRSREADELTSRVASFFPKMCVEYSADLDGGLGRASKVRGLEAVYLIMRSPMSRPDAALIGYVPDYQHQHLPRLFSERERSDRDRIFGELVANSDAMVMNAEAVAKDMRQFTAGRLPPLHVLPFAPNLDPEWLGDRHDLLEPYVGTDPYFIVCNQFWMHKDHLTAFRALAAIAHLHPEVSMVCTGGKTDYRDPGYFSRLEAQAHSLGLGNRLRLLGHIPKRTQVELLKHAVALVQPTLFEGGPGGGATYEAIALGQRVLLSDLPVNREIDQGDVQYFPPGDHVALAKLMEVALRTPREKPSGRCLLSRNEERLKRYGEAIWRAIEDAIRIRNQSGPC